jgi:hypothetical protein
MHIVSVRLTIAVVVMSDRFYRRGFRRLLARAIDGSEGSDASQNHNDQ